VPLTAGTVKLGDEPTQLHQIVDMVEARLRQYQEDTTQVTQDFTQVYEVLFEERSDFEQEKLVLQV
jgi:hypothetical protein